MRVLVTGGAGFVGSSVALGLAARHPDWELVALDNLRRRGSELNLSRLGEGGVEFLHGDVRRPEDLAAAGKVGALVECSAEPSVMAALDDGPDYVVGTNLIGAYNCLELARRAEAFVLFVSSSRVYPVQALRSLTLSEGETRFELADQQPLTGASRAGISEAFPLDGARTMYGATKLAAELLIEEYRDSYGLRAVVDRCGVICGPWQMARSDQGVFTQWVMAHHWGRPLSYIGFGGAGKQVRDLLHPADLVELVDEQLCDPGRWDGVTVNVGGGAECSLSLREASELCAELTGRQLEISSRPETRPGDVPLYVSDCRALGLLTQWRPRHTPAEILADVHAWVRDHDAELERLLLR